MPLGDENTDVRADALIQGDNPAETITETTSPKSFTFSAGDSRDIHDATDVTISNASGASATEDITVELYEGVDTTGTLLDSETRSITVADTNTVTETFLTTNQGLGAGDYTVNITQSGTALSVDSVDEHTLGAEFTTVEQADGTLVTTDQQGRERARVDPVDNRAVYPGAIDASETHSTQITSDSLPHWRIYDDGTDIVAIDETDVEIARDPDAATAWQAAIDAAHAAYDPTFREIPAAIIDGGGLTYALNSSLHITNGADVRNVTFDMSGAAATDQLTVGGPDDTTTNGGVHLQNAVIHSPPTSVRFRDLVYADIDIVVRNAVGIGAEFQGVIGCDIRANVKDAGDKGIEFNDSGSTGYFGNSNRVRARANSCGGEGILNRTLRNTVFIKAISEANVAHGINDLGHGCVWLNPTTEENGDYGLLSSATKCHYKAPHSNNDTTGGFRLSGISDNCRLQGPIRGNGNVTEAGAATDNIIDNVDPASFGSVIGTRHIINGVGSNGANDPAAAGDWFGAGYEGVTVYWDDGAGTNYASKYMNGGWRQIATW